MAPVILRMDVHCYGCAGKIRRVLKNLLGVEEVWVSVDTGLVVVAGTSLDAWLLRWRIQTRTRRSVTVVSDGANPEPQYQYAAPPPAYPQQYHYSSGMQYIGPPPSAPPPAAAYPAYPAAAAGCPRRRRSTCSSTCRRRLGTTATSPRASTCPTRPLPASTTTIPTAAAPCSDTETDQASPAPAAGGRTRAT